MTTSFSVWHTDTDSALKRRVRIETIGKTFVLYEQQWRSEAYFFGDLVYIGREEEAEVFGLEDGIKDRPNWRLGLKGDIPSDISALLPKVDKPLLSNIGILIIAFLCLGIVWFVAG